MTEDMAVKLLVVGLLAFGILVLGGIVTWIVLYFIQRETHA